MPHCAAIAKSTGRRCRSTSVGSDGLCHGHRIAKGLEPLPAGFVGHGLGGRPRTPKLSDVHRELLEAQVEPAIRVLTEALADPDPAIRIKSAQLILERVYGRPRQALELSAGVDDTPVRLGRLVVEGDPMMRRLADQARARMLELDAAPTR